MMCVFLINGIITCCDFDTHLVAIDLKKGKRMTIQDKYIQDNVRPLLPVDIVLAPSWWNKHAGISFDEDFFYHPLKRVEAEQKMEKTLYQRWGQFGIGQKNPESKPVIGAVHLAAGFLIQEMTGCQVDYLEDAPPQVIPAKRLDLSIGIESPFESPAFRRFEKMLESLKTQYGYLTGDVNWSGVLNLGLDLRGESLFMDMFDQPGQVHEFFSKIQHILSEFTAYIYKLTGSTSISVNRLIGDLKKPIFLHSECTHTMISQDDYRKFLMPIDIQWSKCVQPYGIHHCGPDAHRFAACYGEIPHLDFLDVGWGSDVKTLRQYLPNTFLNIRLSPVEILRQTEQEIHDTIYRLVLESGKPELTGVCCINMDEDVEDSKISTIFKTIQELREQFQPILRSGKTILDISKTGNTIKTQ
jgi:hypothetical protein